MTIHQGTKNVKCITSETEANTRCHSVLLINSAFMRTVIILYDDVYSMYSKQCTPGMDNCSPQGPDDWWHTFAPALADTHLTLIY